MEKLAEKTYATQIQPRTGQEIATCWLDAGTEYKFQSTYSDVLGNNWDRILVDGYLYEIEHIHGRVRF